MDTVGWGKKEKGKKKKTGRKIERRGGNENRFTVAGGGRGKERVAQFIDTV